MAYFASQWAVAHPLVALVPENVTPPAQAPDPENIEASCWIRSRLSDIDGPRQHTFGGTDKSEGRFIFQAFSPLDVGTGYADTLIDDAIEILRKNTIGGVEFYPWAETFLGYEEESGYWWQSMGVAPFRVLDDGGSLPVIIAPAVVLGNGPAGYHLYATTSDDTLTELLLNGISRLTLPPGLQATFSIDILGVRTDGGTESAHYVIDGAIRNIGGVVTLVGSLDPRILNTEPGFDFQVSADNTNDALSVKVQGGLYAMNWQAFVLLNRGVIS